ncbi:MAG: hypothetical protein ACYC7D_14180 [Nitrososphaerales archaeon]
MAELSVTLSKLKKYCKKDGSYDLDAKKGAVTLTFVPSFPEAQEKGDRDSPAPRVTMIGRTMGKKVIFDKVEIEDISGVREKDIEEARLTYEGWLGFIEDNY